MAAPVAYRRLRPAAPLARAARSRVLLLVNPRASGARDGEAEAIAGVLREGCAVGTAASENRGHATELAREAARAGYDIVAVAGGDGTVSEAAAGLAGTGVALACLPTGCTNVFARSLGTPRTALEAARRLAAATAEGLPATRTVDLGLVNGRPFVYMSGVGFSASMTATADDAAHRKAHLGQLHFTAAAFSELGRRYLRNPPRMRVEAAGRVAEGVTAIVQNSHVLTYFGPREIRVCEAAGLDTASLSLTSLRRARPHEMPSVIGRLVSGRATAVTAHPQVDAFPGIRSARITALDGEPLPVEADGEFLGEHRTVEYGVAPGALTVLPLRD